MSILIDALSLLHRHLIARVAAQQSPRDQHIELCKAAMVRRRAVMAEMWASVDYPGMCDHAAALGQPYFDLADKQDRAGKQLIAALRKRGHDDDLKLARAIEVTAWP